MNKLKFIIPFMTLFFCYDLSCHAQDRIKETILFSEDPWPPYTIGQPGTSPTEGLAVTLVVEVFKRLDIPIEMQLYPWKRCLEQMKNGQRDALMLLGYSDKRTSFLTYSDPVINVKDIVYFNKAKALNWEKIEDFSGLRFGRTLGFQYGQDFETFASSGRIMIEEAKDDLANFRKLAAGRIDAFIANEITASQILQQYPDVQNQIASAQKPIKEGPLYMGFSKFGKASHLLPDVNKILADLKNEGFIDRVFLGK